MKASAEPQFAFIFGVNWLWHCGVTASFGVFFFHEIQCNGMTSFIEFMISANHCSEFASCRPNEFSQMGSLCVEAWKCWKKEMLFHVVSVINLIIPIHHDFFFVCESTYQFMLINVFNASDIIYDHVNAIFLLCHLFFCSN